MENAVYWKGRQVGIECAGRISWFSSVPLEAFAVYSTPHSAKAGAGVEDSVVAHNLMMTPRHDQRAGANSRD